MFQELPSTRQFITTASVLQGSELFKSSRACRKKFVSYKHCALEKYTDKMLHIFSLPASFFVHHSRSCKTVVELNVLISVICMYLLKREVCSQTSVGALIIFQAHKLNKIN